jgi:hypothetical protein
MSFWIFHNEQNTYTNYSTNTYTMGPSWHGPAVVALAAHPLGRPYALDALGASTSPSFTSAALCFRRERRLGWVGVISVPHTVGLSEWAKESTDPCLRENERRTNTGIDIGVSVHSLSQVFSSFSAITRRTSSRTQHFETKSRLPELV